MEFCCYNQGFEFVGGGYVGLSGTAAFGAATGIADASDGEPACQLASLFRSFRSSDAILKADFGNEMFFFVLVLS